MGTILSLIAVAVLLVLIVVSLKKQRDISVAEKQAAARAYTGEADAQHERSIRRRDSVRAAHREGAPKVDTDTGE